MAKLFKYFKFSFKGYTIFNLSFYLLFIVTLYSAYYYGVNDERTYLNVWLRICEISGVISIFGTMFSIAKYNSKALIAPSLFIFGVFVLFFSIGTYWTPNELVLLAILTTYTIGVYFLAVRFDKKTE